MIKTLVVNCKILNFNSLVGETQKFDCLNKTQSCYVLSLIAIFFNIYNLFSQQNTQTCMQKNQFYVQLKPLSESAETKTAFYIQCQLSF